ncbi:mercuric reductase [Stratiformator vulcanicus]|uniref:Mercuric reductase n=1 Tax=Stratiformator vulcanicus TaxID=2527980 RepID=A0A517R4A0_9PLAN|nr:mercuric reductase [Stratiformator vulcanicus]QDT38691.1 Mercuric reductase [Stratiformator vulcanicus]
MTSGITALEPLIDHNLRLQANVRPETWENPTPQGRYNMVVIGAGTAGLVTAAGAAGLGAKVALIEKSLLGGDCLNVGCVPSKALLSAAHAAARRRRAVDGIVANGQELIVDFPAVMQRMRRLRADISPNDSAERFRSLGVDVYLGEAKFVAEDAVEVEGTRLEFSKACIATGGRAAAPPIDGLVDADYLTNETVFSLTELPRRLVVLGGGPIGCELAQCFARFGSDVTLIERSAHVLARESSEAAAVVQNALIEDGVDLKLNSSVQRVESRGGETIVWYQSNGDEKSIQADRLLIAVGRVPNIDLNLNAAGVEFDERQGIQVSDRLQTSNSRIYAAGDVASKYKFTHAADFLARTVIRNAFFWGRGKASALTIPHATYTSPELAHVGLTESEAVENGPAIRTFRQEFSDIDRAIVEEETAGFVQVHVKKGTDKIVGATVVGEHAGELISQFSLAMTSGIGLGQFAATIYPYPTRAEAVRKLGDQYQKSKLTPFTAKLLKAMIQFTSSK